MRGRRVALLLTGLWPLLAKDDVPATDTNVTIEDEHHATHDTLEQSPKRPLHTMLTSNPSNIVMVDPVFENIDDLEQDILEEAQDDSIIRKAQHVEGGKVSHDAQERQRQPQHQEESTGEEENHDKDPLLNQDDTISQDVDETDDTASREEPEPTDSVEVSDGASSLTRTDDESAEPSTQQIEEAIPEEAVLNDTTTSADADESESSESDRDKSRQSDDDDEEEDVATDRVLVDYASKSAGALILEKSPAMKGTSNLLNGDNDKYAIAPCAEKKFVVINLSEDILVKQVKLANFERYSSHLKDFQIMGSQTMGEWVDLGTYTAEPGNGEQAFDLNEPAWARYLKFRFLTHHGSEHYCTYSQIKVHGSTMLQGFHEQWDSENESEDGGPETGETEGESSDGEAAEDVGEGTARTSDEIDSTSEEKQNAKEDDGKEGETSSEPAVDELESQDPSKAYPESASGDVHSKDDDDEESHVAETSDHESNENDATSSSAVSDGENNDDATAATDETASPENVKEDPMKSEMPTLSTASIPVSSHDASVSDRVSSTEQLDTTAMKPAEKGLKAVVTTVVKEMATAEAIMSVKDAETVLDEVKNIQESLKKTGAMPSTASVEAKVDEDDSHSVDVVAVEKVTEKQPNASKASPEVPTKEESTRGNESDGVEVESVSTGQKVEDEERKDGKSTNRLTPAKEEKPEAGPADSKGENDDQTSQRTRSEVVESTEKSKQERIDPTIASIVARFPSAACLKNLDYENFKAKISASRANAQGSQPSGHGKMEPIFKLLTDEIKGLQTSQSVQDQYMKALISCYQQVMLEMANTLNHVETHQEKRLSDLEEAMDAARSSILANLFALAAGVVTTCVSGVQWLYLSVAASLHTLVASGFVSDMTVAVLSLAFFSLCLLVTGYIICAVRVKSSTKRMTRIETVASADASVKATNSARNDTNNESKRTNGASATPSDSRRIPEPALAPDIVQSENESEHASDSAAAIPVIALVPRPEKQTTEQPNLVPLD